VAQQLREATPFGEGPRFLIRDNDKKYGDQFQHVVDGADIDLLKTPVEAPRANAFCERFMGSFETGMPELHAYPERAPSATHCDRPTSPILIRHDLIKAFTSASHVPHTYPTMLTVRSLVCLYSAACITTISGKRLEIR